MNLKVGIVGLPNAGKSTLFNALLKKQVAEAANYPFTTIEPNVGVVPVPDGRLEKLVALIEQEEHVKPPIVPATVEFVDIAGLVKGASQGEGLGNKFLSHIREVDLVVNVLREFEDPSVVHVAGDVDLGRDADIIQTELLLADLQTLAKQTEPRGVVEHDARRRWELVGILRAALDSGKPARDIITDSEERILVRDLHLLTMKPVLLVANVSESQLSLPRGPCPTAGVQAGNSQILQLSNYPILQISAKIEAELVSLSPEEQEAYLKELGLTSSGLDRLIAKAYELLGLISFLTCGIKEVRAWTITRGTKAPQAAGVIHTDFEKKFIKADVIAYSDFASSGGWKNARDAGKARSEGKEYIVRDWDVVEFKVGN